jgi:hypothetical protein
VNHSSTGSESHAHAGAHAVRATPTGISRRTATGTSPRWRPGRAGR